MEKPINVVDYDPHWEIMFKHMEQALRNKVEHLISDIQHVGSTSVPGLAAKPVLDIDLVIEKYDDLAPVITTLATVGYGYLGDMGIPGRHAFRHQKTTGSFWKHSEAIPAHHLYCCIRDSDSFQNHISFRDYLRSNPDAVRRYSDLKKKLAQLYPFDIDKYVEMKTPFITGILAEAGFSRGALQAIRDQNKANIAPGGEAQ